jgi:hypothetical protein
MDGCSEISIWVCKHPGRITNEHDPRIMPGDNGDVRNLCMTKSAGTPTWKSVFALDETGGQLRRGVGICSSVMPERS